LDVSLRGISKPLIALLLIVLVAGGAGAYLFVGRGNISGTTSTSSASTTSMESTVSTSTGQALRIVLDLQPNVPLAASDVTANYSLSFNVLSGPGGPLDFSTSGTPGVSVKFDPPEVQEGTNSGKVSVSILATSSASTGFHPFNITASQGGSDYVQQFQVEVVKHLVVTVGVTFVPANMTISAGDSVYWMRTNGAIDQYDNGQHNVDIRVPGVVSPTLQQYDSWSYTFTQDGDFSYYCTFHASMTGEVIVSPG